MNTFTPQQAERIRAMVYPLVSARNACDRYLMRSHPTFTVGSACVVVSRQLAGLETLVRSLYPFDPTGL